LKATVLTGGVRLSWAAPQGQGSYPLSGYAVSRRWQSTGTYDLLSQLTVTAYVDLNPDSSQGSQPSYRVAAVDSDGGLSSGITLPAKLAAAAANSGVPSAVTRITAVTVAQSGVPVSLAWSPNPEADKVTGYLVYRGTSLLGGTTALSWSDSPGVGVNAD